MGIAEAIVMSIVVASTPLWLAALGELVAERAGVLNLGVEGMMVMGAVCGFIASYTTGNALFGVLGAIAAGMAMAALFGVLTLYLVTNQVATGLALTLLGLGLSGLVGQTYANTSGVKITPIYIPGLTDLPLVGKVLFGHDPLVYLTLGLTAGVSWFLFRTRGGLILRAVGDNHTSAHALGYSVVRVRFLAILFGGGCAGLAGAYLSMVSTSQWLDHMTNGRGWIALALVVFATWLPWRVAVGALLFGTVGILQFHAQALGVSVPAQFLSALPYVVTIVVLVIISGNKLLARSNTPAMLGRSFVADR